MFHDEIADGRLAQSRKQFSPVHSAMSDVFPAVFVGFFTGYGDILDMDRKDSVAIAPDPFKRVGTTFDNPRNIRLPCKIGRSIEDMFLWYGTVGQRAEFEIMVVPAKCIARLAIMLSSDSKAFSELLPTGNTIRAAVCIEIRAENSLHIGDLGNLQNTVDFVLQHIQTKVSGRHGKSQCVEVLL